MLRVLLVVALTGAICRGALHAQTEPVRSDTDSETIELTAEWGRIAHSSHRRHHDATLAEILQPGAAVTRKRYGWDAFERLLPEAEVEVGAVYPLDFEAVRPFLEQIHRRPRARSHMEWASYPGAHAVLLERAPDRIDLLFRVHVEFELVEGEVFFTVSQVEGRLVIDPERRQVVGFRLAVPARSYNYDVHIRRGNRMLIDIGFVPALGVGGGFLPRGREDAARLGAARQALRRAFYPFARLDWRPLEAGLREARNRKRPLHLVTIFGQLDDESC